VDDEPRFVADANRCAAARWEGGHGRELARSLACGVERRADGGAPGRTGRGCTVRRDLSILDWFQKTGQTATVPGPCDFESLLRGVALRVTRPRVAVLSAVHRYPHAATDSIISVVREDLGEVSHQAVYDVLRALTAVGLVRRIQPAGLVARYEARVGDNHHHVVCRACGAIADVDCAVGDAPCLAAADGPDYAIDEAEVIYWGRCPECVAVGDQPTARAATSDRKRTARQEKDRRV